MSLRRHSGPHLLGLLSLVLVVAGTVAAYGEVRAFFGGPTLSSRFEALSTGGVEAGASTFSRQTVLETCHATMISVFARVQPTLRRRALLSGCLAQADAIVSGSPSFSYAWFVGALAASGLGEVDLSLERLLQSQRTGPTEQWIAELRVRLGERYFDRLGPELRANHERDLRLLVGSSRGIASIARRYVAQSNFRARITAIVETMDEGAQAGFVATVRRIVAQTGGA